MLTILFVLVVLTCVGLLGVKIFFPEYWRHFVVAGRFIQRRPSTILAFIVWSFTGFGYTPGIATGIAHFIIVPIGIAILVWTAHWEGKQDHKRLQEAMRSTEDHHAS